MQISGIGRVSGLAAEMQGQGFWDFGFSDSKGSAAPRSRTGVLDFGKAEGPCSQELRQESRGEILVDFRTDVQKR